MPGLPAKPGPANPGFPENPGFAATPPGLAGTLLLTGAFAGALGLGGGGLPAEASVTKPPAAEIMQIKTVKADEPTVNRQKFIPPPLHS